MVGSMKWLTGVRFLALTPVKTDGVRAEGLTPKLLESLTPKLFPKLLKGLTPVVLALIAMPVFAQSAEQRLSAY